MQRSGQTFSGNRRRFLGQLLGLSGLATVPRAIGQLATAQSRPGADLSFRFAFLTDLHLLPKGELRSEEGIAACLQSVEILSPRPDFILVGGDLVNSARDLTVKQAAVRFNAFKRIWRDNTNLPTYWTFGNHDLVGTYNSSVSPSEAGYGKELFKQKFKLPRLFYSFNHKGWHFVVLDDIDSLPGHAYQGLVNDEELRFLAEDLDLHREMPTVLCLHMPLWTNLMLSMESTFRSVCCTNQEAVQHIFPRHNIRLVLSGHIHQFQTRQTDGIHFVNSGAVCGNYWKGPMFSCPEGYGVVDLSPTGTSMFTYRDFGWKALQS